MRVAKFVKITSSLIAWPARPSDTTPAYFLQCSSLFTMLKLHWLAFCSSNIPTFCSFLILTLPFHLVEEIGFQREKLGNWYLGSREHFKRSLLRYVCGWASEAEWRTAALDVEILLTQAEHRVGLRVPQYSNLLTREAKSVVVPLHHGGLCLGGGGSDGWSLKYN